MPSRKLQVFIPILIPLSVLLLFGGLLLFWSARTADAQCGSQASSCKNCHEVQGKDPVNAKGEWHVSHAFGDFCANCHAGNVQATDKDAAHQGMVAPLSDIQANCASCHPSDTQARAEKYAAVLNVKIGPGGSSSGGAPSTGPSSGGGAKPATNPPAAPANPPAAPAMVVSDANVIDYSQRYDQTVMGQVPINWGNVILVILIAIVATGGGAYVYWNERRLRRAAGKLPLPVAKATPVAGQPIRPEDYPPEVVALLPDLAQLNPFGIQALKRLLQDPDDASELLYRLSRLDPELVRRIRMLDNESRALLLAMAGGD